MANPPACLSSRTKWKKQLIEWRRNSTESRKNSTTGAGGSQMDTSSAISVTSDESDATCTTATPTAAERTSKHQSTFEVYGDLGVPADANSDIDISEDRHDVADPDSE